MCDYYYFDISIRFQDSKKLILKTYFKAAIENSLREVFGEIGGTTTIDLLKFDENLCRGIIRFPETFYVKLRAALTLTCSIQDAPCKFEVHGASPTLLFLLDNHIDFST